MDVVKRGVNDLVGLRIVEKRPSKPGQVNEYEVKLPSEIREVQEMVKRDQEKTEEVIDDSKDDFYTNSQKRIEILKREDYKCFYCLRELQRDNFYLDHLVPRTEGGQNYRSNLVASCGACNSKKSALDPKDFLLQNYRKGLLTQEEYQTQRGRLIELREEYRRVEDG
jgi:hypothetical protein